MGAVLNFAGVIETETCTTCGIKFGLPKHFIATRREDKKSFHCPNGHVLSYTTSEVDRLKEQLEAQKQRTVSEERRRRDAEERAERNWKTLRQTQGKLNAAKKRVGNGVCPCCNRTFKQLARHMDAKHPDYKQPEPEVGP